MGKIPKNTPERIAELRAMPYAAYLQTGWWQVRRRHAIVLSGYRCANCGARHRLNVHHLTYVRRGEERDEDLQVLCSGCHLGGHIATVQEEIARYARLVREAQRTAGPDIAEIVDEAKQLCIKAGISSRGPAFEAALSRVLADVPFVPPVGKELLYDQPKSGPYTHAEACGILARLGAGRLIRPMPEPPAPVNSDHFRALEILLAGITDQRERVEAAERTAIAEESKQQHP